MSERRNEVRRIFSLRIEEKILETKTRGVDSARRTYLHEGHRQVRGTYSFECGRCNSAGRTRNAVSWKLGQRVFELDGDSGKGGVVEGRKRDERENEGGKEREKERPVV